MKMYEKVFLIFFHLIEASSEKGRINKLSEMLRTFFFLFSEDQGINRKNIRIISYHLIDIAFQRKQSFILILFHEGLFQTLNTALIHVHMT